MDNSSTPPSDKKSPTSADNSLTANVSATETPTPASSTTPAVDAPQAKSSGPEAASPAESNNYKVFTAVGDTLRAIKQNLATYLASILVGLGIAVVAAIIFGVLLLSGLAALLPSAGSGYNAAGLVFLGLGAVLMTGLYIAIGAFLLNYMSLAVNAGADGQKTGVGQTIKESFHHLKRVFLAQLLLVSVLCLPILATLSVFFMVFTPPDASMIGWAILLVIAAMIVFYILLFRFMLAPYVALFEPQTPVLKTLSRSRQLMVGGGQWFVFKGTLLMIGLFVVIALITGSDPQDSASVGSILSNLLTSAISLVASSCLVLLYRNRKQVKGSS